MTHPATLGCSEHAEGINAAPQHIPAHSMSTAHLRSPGTRAASRASESQNWRAAGNKSPVWRLPRQISQLKIEEETWPSVALIKVKLKSVFLDKAGRWKMRKPFSSSLPFPNPFLWTLKPSLNYSLAKYWGIVWWICCTNSLGLKHIPVIGM